MSHQIDKIRSLAVVVIRRGDSILVSPGYDKTKNTHFYRLLGGGIDFGEESNVALKREIKEELGVELKNVKLLKVTENIFTYNNEPGHEICFIYEGEFQDEAMYNQEEFTILDSDREGKAIWLKIELDNIKMIMPPGLEKFLV